MDDGARPEAPVDAEVQVELGGRGELTLNVRTVEADDRHLLGDHRRQLSAGRGDRDQLPGACADVAGGAEHQAQLRQAVTRPRDPLALIEEPQRSPLRTAGS
jgi:hypothetical protein